MVPGLRKSRYCLTNRILVDAGLRSPYGKASSRHQVRRTIFPGLLARTCNTSFQLRQTLCDLGSHHNNLLQGDDFLNPGTLSRLSPRCWSVGRDCSQGVVTSRRKRVTEDPLPVGKMGATAVVGALGEGTGDHQSIIESSTSILAAIVAGLDFTSSESPCMLRL